MADERDELDEAIHCLEWKEAMEPGCTWERTERARSIRARERKLAELAHLLIEDRRRSIGWEPDDLDRRYEDACND